MDTVMTLEELAKLLDTPYPPDNHSVPVSRKVLTDAPREWLRYLKLDTPGGIFDW